MKKIFRKIKNFTKKHKKLLFICLLIFIILIGAIFFLSKSGVTTVKKVKKILGTDYYNIECLDNNCNYISAYKGDKLGKYTVFVYDANGKKIAKVKDTYNSKSSYVKTISGVNKKYLIFNKSDYASGKSNGYMLTSTTGKVKYNSDNILQALTDDLISEKLDDNYQIVNTKGKVVFSNVNEIEKYADGDILSISIKNENIITNSKGEAILNGYRIVSEIKDKKDNTLYFILEDSNKNAYYYYNHTKNKIIGDSFNGYVTGTNDGELVITKKENGTSRRYILTKDGKQKELTNESTSELVDSIKKNISSDDFTLYTDSVKLDSQKAVLVNNIKENSFGIYNISSKKYTKLYSYKEDNGVSTIYELVSNEKELYVQINCSTNYCEKTTMIIYDLINNKELYRVEDENNIPQNYTEYEDNYKVIKYSLNSSDDYKGKYVLYDKKNKEILKSDNQIVVVDKKLVFGKTPSNQSLMLYSTKQNKALNDDTHLGSKISISSTTVYKYSDENKTYLLNENGKLLKELYNSSASLIYSSDAIIYIEKNKVNIINPVASKAKSYKLKTNEKINDNSGENIAPYKNAIYVNNSVDNYVKVININGRTVKKIKNSSIDRVRYNKKEDSVIIITKRVKNNNNLYGLYIAK